MKKVLVYGANGYSGRKVAERLIARGVQPIVAGRNKEAITLVGEQLGVESRSFSLDDSEAVATGLTGVAVVVHCAGPFSATSGPMLDACIKNHVNYLDITGEYQVIEAAAARDSDIKAAGILAMCSVGFDVVPSDCLIAHVSKRLPSATHVDIFVRLSDQLSPGTVSTMVEGLGLPNIVRENDKLVEKPSGALHKSVEFPDGKVAFVGIPWGDIASAWRTTHIPNIYAYMALGWLAPYAMSMSRWFKPVLQSSSVQSSLKSLVKRFISGPGEEWTATARSELIAEARDDNGKVCRSYLRTPEGYELTTVTACEIALRVLSDKGEPGYHTPAGLFGPDFILQFEGVERRDLC
jgi:short subunit dehydrogenase-like uncharacterized protein